MSHLFGVGLNIECNRIINELRMQLQKRAGIALRTFGLVLYKAGNNLSFQQFERALASYNIFLTKV